MLMRRVRDLERMFIHEALDQLNLPDNHCHIPISGGSTMEFDTRNNRRVTLGNPHPVFSMQEQQKHKKSPTLMLGCRKSENWL
jgi:hypothetical protein